ncbi:hypothetical protein Tco_1387169 [Tanacetum coccineum]
MSSFFEPSVGDKYLTLGRSSVDTRPLNEVDQIKIINYGDVVTVSSLSVGFIPDSQCLSDLIYPSSRLYKTEFPQVWRSAKIADLFILTFPGTSLLDINLEFDPNEEDDIWLNQHYWELLRSKLHEYSGVHSLFLDGTSIQINMLVDKKYPLKKEILKRMINLKIEAEEYEDFCKIQ